jgi:hypothetical protein
VSRPGNRAGFFIARRRRAQSLALVRRVAPPANWKGTIMPFQKGQSGNPEGRPPGARNRATILAEQLLEGEAEAIARVAIEKAKDGDIGALRLCLDRLTPPRKARTLEVDLPALESPADAAEALSAVAAAVGEGAIAPSEAADIVKVVDGFARVYEIVALEQRISDLEAAQEAERSHPQ